jgi:hypothetical protein
MAITKNLEMIFQSLDGRSVTITVPDPKDDLTQNEVETAMNTIIAKNIFQSSGGDLVAISEARIVQREVTSLISGE